MSDPSLVVPPGRLRELYEALGRCHQLTPRPKALPLLLCGCGSIEFSEAIVQYWGWHAMLVETVAACRLCGRVESRGRTIIEEGLGTLWPVWRPDSDER